MKANIHDFSRKRKCVAAGAIANKRTKAYKLHYEEVQSALREWERHLNRICTDPAPILVENNVDLEGPPQVHYPVAVERVIYLSELVECIQVDFIYFNYTFIGLTPTYS